MHRVQVSDAVKGYIDLPNGGSYSRNQIVSLTDTQFAEIPRTDLIFVLDLGGYPDVPPPPPGSEIRDLQAETNARILADQGLSHRIGNLESGQSMPYLRGIVTLVGGTATVSSTNVGATSRIFLTAQTLGTVTVPQALAVTGVTAGVSFTITSADPTDTSDVAYLIIDPVLPGVPAPRPPVWPSGSSGTFDPAASPTSFSFGPQVGYYGMSFDVLAPGNITALAYWRPEEATESHRRLALWVNDIVVASVDIMNTTPGWLVGDLSPWYYVAVPATVVVTEWVDATQATDGFAWVGHSPTVVSSVNPSVDIVNNAYGDPPTMSTDETWWVDFGFFPDG